MARNYKYSIWFCDHESCHHVECVKIKDTNSTKEIIKYLEKSWYYVASFFRPEESINANYLQTFER